MIGQLTMSSECQSASATRKRERTAWARTRKRKSVMTGLDDNRRRASVYGLMVATIKNPNEPDVPPRRQPCHDRQRLLVDDVREMCL